MTWARVGMLLVTGLGWGACALAAEEWSLWRATIAPQKETVWIKYPLFTMNKTRDDCMRRLYGDLSESLATSFPPAPAVDTVEGKRENPNVWVYRRLGKGGKTLGELRLYCVPNTTDPRKTNTPQ